MGAAQAKTMDSGQLLGWFSKPLDDWARQAQLLARDDVHDQLESLLHVLQARQHTDKSVAFSATVAKMLTKADATLKGIDHSLVDFAAREKKVLKAMATTSKLEHTLHGSSSRPKDRDPEVRSAPHA